MAAVQEIQVFAMTTQMEDVLLSQASTLGLVITHSGKERSGRGSMQRQRIWFGLSKKIRDRIKLTMLQDGKIPLTLFRFNRHVDGVFYASTKNVQSVELYREYHTLLYQGANRTDACSPEHCKLSLPKVCKSPLSGTHVAKASVALARTT